MTYEQIETFLTVITYGNISAAAKKLFVSQSTVSSRIQLLEEELGTQLLVRSRGQRTIELTNAGSAFVSLAGQWSSLWKETRQLKTIADIRSLTIAGVDALNNFTFVPLFNSYIDRHPETKLTVRTHHSDEIHDLVERRTADIGFVFSQVRYPDIISKPVYRELMYLLCHKNSPYHNEMPCEELCPEDEVYIKWGTDTQEWHDRHWSPERPHLLTVNTGSMLQHYLHTPGRWAVAPMSVIHAVSRDSDLTYYTFQDPPEPRICYMLTSRYPNARQNTVIREFENALKAFVESSSDICTFEEWMVQE
ncbi:MAG: LysR family transcriptional regulator [Lachnospiraceae bacterium]|nr:LysR family transcriptional regulator [Lachnospiraceae bacterium]